ncbi:MAG: hypothetical protein P4L84_27715 [Isosphaeraceae bacterium]|nr:hypothetical protein [Isosphaeraceae bacterium]
MSAIEIDDFPETRARRRHSGASMEYQRSPVTKTPDWHEHEVESEVYCPGSWLLLTVGTFFLLAGTIGFLTVGGIVPPGIPFWIARGGAGVLASLGAVVLAWTIRRNTWPARVRHAASDALPNVPQEPLIREGSVVHGRLTHELEEGDHGWEFRPRQNLWRNDRWFLLGFGIPFLVIFSGLMTWVLHDQLRLAWSISIPGGTMATVLCGGSTFLLIGMVLRSGYRRLCRLSIPCHEDDLELDFPEEAKLERADLTAGLKWVFLGDTKRQRLTIPLEFVGAVQLCPWKFVVAGPGGRQLAWAVQGSLVLVDSPAGEYHRIPLLLTSDFVGAARLMQKLAATLDVPYLFCADAEGWKAEEMRAKDRRPLRIGGTQG